MATALMHLVLNKTRALAEVRARAFLCGDCIDKRCKSGRVCKAYDRQVEACAWEIAAEGAEKN